MLRTIDSGATNKAAKALIEKINYLADEIDHSIALMEVCGTHTMAIGKSGIRKVLPPNVRLISGPGCPVCVTHDWEIDGFINLAKREGVVIATFGDLLKVPGPNGSLADAKTSGADVKIVYSTLDALKLARKQPNQEVVFLGVGFETTAPTVATSIIQAAEEGIENYSVLSMHKLVPPALRVLVEDPHTKVDGFICPGHVSTIIGVEPYEFISDEYKKPCVIAGFEQIDILQSIYMLLEQMSSGSSETQLQYTRAVSQRGNSTARMISDQVFETSTAWWRGIGPIENSGLAIKPEYKAYDARIKFNLIEPENKESYINKSCSCGDILKGHKLPPECQLFGKGCNPMKPLGPCMVSSEGACAAYYKYNL
ncbi:hydrogenase expression/formation protein HypD [Desulfitispora alkaliphila]|uniref:hydrogenase formation protein HypD n=1 Tax=Desulfitispora alkaliphila TaxID=622674 RepID=UPI003D1E15B1